MNKFAGFFQSKYPASPDVLENLFEKNPETIRSLKKKLLPAANMLKETTSTTGWKEILEPFLIRHGNAERLLGKSAEEREKLAPKIEAFNHFLKLIRNIISVSDLPDIPDMEEEKEAEE
jgi:hypothetical protein